MVRLSVSNKVVYYGNLPPYDLASLPPETQRKVKLILFTLRLWLFLRYSLCYLYMT